MAVDAAGLVAVQASVIRWTRRRSRLVAVLGTVVHRDVSVADGRTVLAVLRAVELDRLHRGTVVTVVDDPGDEGVDAPVVVCVDGVDGDLGADGVRVLVQAGQHVGADAVLVERTDARLLGGVHHRHDGLDARVQLDVDDLVGLVLARPAGCGLVAGDVHDGVVLRTRAVAVLVADGAEGRHGLDVAVGVLHEGVQVVVLLTPAGDEGVLAAGRVVQLVALPLADADERSGVLRRHGVRRSGRRGLHDLRRGGTGRCRSGAGLLPEWHGCVPPGTVVASQLS